MIIIMLICQTSTAKYFVWYFNIFNKKNKHIDLKNIHHSCWKSVTKSGQLTLQLKKKSQFSRKNIENEKCLSTESKEQCYDLKRKRIIPYRMRGGLLLPQLSYLYLNNKSIWIIAALKFQRRIRFQEDLSTADNSTIDNHIWFQHLPYFLNLQSGSGSHLIMDSRFFIPPIWLLHDDKGRHFIHWFDLGSSGCRIM